MMIDHLVLSQARNKLADALKVLLNPDIMTSEDFGRSRDLATEAVGYLTDLIADDLLRQPNRNAT